MTALAPERQFVTFDRGEIREIILGSYRASLFGQINPDTGQIFTSEEIATATAPGSARYIEADAIDLVLLASQQRALWLADQVRPDRASTASLQNLWLPLWLPDGYLQASGGSGLVDTGATPGTVWTGSTKIPDATAVYGTDPAGNRFQVLTTVTTPGSGTARLTVVGIDTGDATNLEAGTTITWANPPVSATGPGTTVAKFSGGIPAEDDAAFARRLIFRIRHKPAAGNNAQIYEWGTTAGNNDAVEAAFVYACAMHAGTVRVAITQNRGSIRGPAGRIAAVGTIAQVTAYLVPPASPVMPTPPFVVVTTCDPVSSDMVIDLSMPVGNPAGWEDLQPFPGESGGTPTTITAITDSTHFQITSLTALPVGITAPSMMIWDDSISRFEQLLVLSVTLNAGNVYDVVLQQAANKSLSIGDRISPYTQRADIIAETIEQYFDSLGPGELVDLATDGRAHRAFRFPVPNEDFPQRAGSAVISDLQDALGASLATGILQAISATVPAIPSDPVLPPKLLVAGKIGIYAV